LKYGFIYLKYEKRDEGKQQHPYDRENEKKERKPLDLSFHNAKRKVRVHSASTFTQKEEEKETLSTLHNWGEKDRNSAL
jgi:hypothetical protein